jgi:hypothetical protein
LKPLVFDDRFSLAHHALRHGKMSFVNEKYAERRYGGQSQW